MRTFCTFPHECRSSSARPLSIVPDGIEERRDGTAHDRFHADHGPPTATLRPPPSDLVQRTGDVTVATDLGVPRSTARGWLGAAPTVVVCSGCCGPHGAGAPTGGPEAAATRPEAHGAAPARRGPASKLWIHVDARASARRTRQDPDPARRGSGPRVCAVAALLRFLRVSPSRFHAWRRLQHACALDDQSSCPHTSPHRLTPPEVRAIKDMVTALEYRHVPTGTLALLRSGSARSGLPPQPGTTSCGSSAGAAPAPRASGEAEGRPSHDGRRRDVAHRHHRDPPARRDPRLPARGD
jgi:hypothetical protein